ncbi:hypothetical protein DFH08DRAFT_799280 [Mycena albidolilacea]|uniref:Uncharacterized protein n=1 Tax=Mycena albidolilacea TaxID=1033008 RepID=A0AAD7ALH0_9AGAR|nr:hypothetical protein DFH08DRAFT_799280 [Mycena albidolilacea]
MFEYFWTAGSVMKSKSHHQLLSIVAQITVGIILVMRTYALYGSSRRVLAFMLCFAIVVFGFGAWSVGSVKLLPQPSADSYPPIGCANSLSTEMAHRLGYAWTGILAFDAMILVLTIWKGCETYRLSSCSGKRRQGLVPTLVRDGVVYFLVVAVANCANIISYMVAGPYLRGVGSTLTTVLTTVMGCRLMLNIRDPKLIAIRSGTTMIKTRTSDIDDTPITTVFP